MSRFLDALSRRPLLLDAAMGTRLLARGLDLSRDDPCLWTLDRPDDVLDLHRRDVAAGADAVLTDTFGANRKALDRLGRSGDVVAINQRAVELAREVVRPDRFVIGSIGPQAHADGDATREQVLALSEAGADAILFETHRSEEARSRLVQVQGLKLPPLLISLSFWGPTDRDQELFGSKQGLAAFGSNCLIGMDETLQVAKRMRGRVDVPLIAEPSAGLPGQSPASPESFAEAVPRLLALGVRLIGGCCGTTEAHIAALRSALNASA